MSKAIDRLTVGVGKKPRLKHTVALPSVAINEVVTTKWRHFKIH